MIPLFSDQGRAQLNRIIRPGVLCAFDVDGTLCPFRGYENAVLPDEVRQRLNIACKPGERFLFFYGDRLETNGLGRVFLAHCAMHEDNPFSYCDNYFYYSWKP